MINWKKVKENIPSNFKIKGQTWEVLYVKEFLDGKTLGETRPTEKQIVLLDSMSPKTTVSTFYHELQHCISMCYDVDLTEKQVLNYEKSVAYILPLLWNLNK